MILIECDICQHTYMCQPSIKSIWRYCRAIFLIMIFISSWYPFNSFIVKLKDKCRTCPPYPNIYSIDVAYYILALSLSDMTWASRVITLRSLYDTSYDARLSQEDASTITPTVLKRMLIQQQCPKTIIAFDLTALSNQNFSPHLAYLHVLQNRQYSDNTNRI